MSAVRQWKATQDRHNLALTPPLAPEFFYNTPEVTERARAWALENKYVLATGVPPCAHGLYLMSACPAYCRSRVTQLDHAAIWVPARPGEFGRPFILSHPYSDDVAEETIRYAEYHGLREDAGGPGDDKWYSGAALPIRWELPTGYPVWPIEEVTAVLLATQPVAWPGKDT